MGGWPSKEEVTQRVEQVLKIKVGDFLHPSEKELLQGETTLTILIAGTHHAGKSALINTI